MTRTQTGINMRGPNRKARRASLLLLCITSGCALTTATPSAPSPADGFVSERLFFGQSIPGGGLVASDDWATFLRDVITPRFPQGLTVWRAEGQWLEAAGVLAREPVIVVEIVQEPSQDLERRLEEIGLEYKRRFRQEAVLRVTSPIRQRVYEES